MTTAQILQLVETTATDLTPVAGDVGDVANFGTSLVKLITPAITDNEIQSLNDQFQSDMRDAANELAALQANPNDLGTRAAFGNYAERVCSDAGVPFAGGMGAGTLVGTPLGFVLANFQLAATVKLLRAQLAKQSAGSQPSTGGK